MPLCPRQQPVSEPLYNCHHITSQHHFTVLRLTGSALSVSYLLLWFGPCLALSLCLLSEVFQLSCVWICLFWTLKSQLQLHCFTCQEANTFKSCWGFLTLLCLSSSLVSVSFLYLRCFSSGFLLRLPLSPFALLFMWSSGCIYNAAAGCCCLECPFLTLF